jgi:hypothetical protein
MTGVGIPILKIRTGCGTKLFPDTTPAVAFSSPMAMMVSETAGEMLKSVMMLTWYMVTSLISPGTGQHLPSSTVVTVTDEIKYRRKIE